MASLSKRFQKETTAWYDVACSVEATQDIILAFKQADGMYMKALVSELKFIDEESDDESDEEAAPDRKETDSYGAVGSRVGCDSILSEM